MPAVLGPNQYGKAETRLVRIYRGGDGHEIRDLNVTTTLRGDFAAAHATGDQANVLPTDSQKNTCFAFASSPGVDEIEDYALALARHFVADIEPVREARVEVEEYRWERASVTGAPHPHAFTRADGEVRTAAATVSGSPGRAWITSGLTGLLLLKSAGSEFAGFLKDRYTTLEETHDRVLATSLTARWRYAAADAPAGGWNAAHARVRRALIETFAGLHSLALQQSLWEMGRAALDACGEVAEIRLSAPNKHHFLADLAPFGLDNPGQVYYAADRPYGLIQVAVLRDGAPDPGPAWESASSFC
jgi:urate oxidase